MCPKTFNLWVTVINFDVGDCMVGPQVLPHRLAGNIYRDFLSHDLPKLLEEVPLAVRAWIWYMHVGAPAHFSRALRDVLSNTYHDQWTVRGGPTAWPPHSTPNLNPLDFYLWEYLRTRVYAAPVDNEEALWMPVRLSATAPAFCTDATAMMRCVEVDVLSFQL
jgi:hypothetical protein